MATLIVIEDVVAPATVGRGGHAMYVLQWLHGLTRLGHDVYLLEFLGDDCKMSAADASRAFAETLGSWWEPEKCALIFEKSRQSIFGLDVQQVSAVAAKADGLVTLAAHYRREPYPFIEAVRPRILIETDPGYTHLWAAEGDAKDIFGEHDFYFTVGGNIGTSRCKLPTIGIDWRPIFNPAILDWWKSGAPTRNVFTTVADWRSFGYLEFDGQVLGPKAEEFRKFITLPALAGEPIEIALNIEPDDPDNAFLAEHGWKIVSPKLVSTPSQYQEYVKSSVGEFSCVKGGYAGTHCGWFSDRSACYLAAGRPVVVQSTGFEELLPVGKGLFAVSTVEEANEAIRAIRKDYAMHSDAARDIAREFFDSDGIVGRVLKTAGISKT